MTGRGVWTIVSCDSTTVTF